MFTIFQKFSFNQIQKQISKSLDGKLVDFWSNPPSNPLGDLWNTYLLMVMRNRCRMQEGDKMLLAHCSPFLVSPDDPEPAFLTLQAAHFLARLGPRSDSRDSSQSASRAEPRRERERETPGPVAVTSVSPGPEIQIHQLQTVRRSAAQIYCGFLEKRSRFSFPSQGGEDVTQS